MIWYTHHTCNKKRKGVYFFFIYISSSHAPIPFNQFTTTNHTRKQFSTIWYNVDHKYHLVSGMYLCLCIRFIIYLKKKEEINRENCNRGNMRIV